MISFRPSSYWRVIIFRLWLVAGLLWGGLLSTRAQAGLPHYIIRSWYVEDGLPRNSVTAAVQTRDGYLWLGTYTGLARFDGVRFVVFNDNNTPALKNNRITSLFEAADGTLWIGHETGDVTRFNEGRFEAVPMTAAWNVRKILSIGADDAGDNWLVNTDGLLARLRDGKVLTPEAGGVAAVVDVAADRRGKIWIARNGKVSALLHGELSVLPLNLQSTNSYAQGICPASDGGLWIVTDNRIRKWDGTKWTEDRGSPAWGYGPLSSFVELSSGFLAAGTANQGLLLISPAGETLRFGRTNGLSHDWVRFLCEDREGNLWAGTGTGLNMLRPSNVMMVSPPDAWQGRAVLSVTAARDGSLWVGTEGAGVYCWRDDVWSRFSYDNSGLKNPFVWSVAEDETGQVWAGTWAGGIYVRRTNDFEAATRLENFSLPAPALLPARGGGLWIGTGTGLLRYESSGMTKFGRNVGLESPEVRSVAEAMDGTVWFGMYGGGLGCLTEGKARQFRKRDGLASDFVQCLKLETNGTLWIGTFGGGLSRLKDGRFANVGVDQGLPNNVICHIEDDGRGYFWMSSYGGIFRVSKTELEDCADGKISIVRSLGYGKGDGLPTLECSGGMQPAGCRTVDGLLWFPTSMGLVVLDPVKVTTNRLTPPVVIEEFRVDGRVLTNTGVTPVQIAPGRQRFDFQFTALSFVSPERVQFRCRLEGLEEDWIDMGSRRSVNYNFVPPGDYTFHVVACNNDNVWNETGAQLAFHVRPYFWQTTWFHVLGGFTTVVMASGAVWFDTRRRMHRKLERLERQRALERERARIARDIHDDLGASLTQITMLSQVAHGAPPELPRAVASLDQIFGTARELTRALDEIVWAVNPTHDTLESLAGYLGKFAQDYLRAAHIRCWLNVPIHLPAWALTSEVRHNLFLAVKEALHNVVKHASATEVRITLTLASDSFAWEVADNGRGFVNGETSLGSSDRLASGNGLANMSRRLADIGGHCEVQSAPGGGTRVKFAVMVKAIES